MSFDVSLAMGKPPAALGDDSSCVDGNLPQASASLCILLTPAQTLEGPKMGGEGEVMSQALVLSGCARHSLPEVPVGLSSRCPQWSPAQ